ncbi:hypothetical protein [Jiangella alkaliphila]|uniref:TcpE family protein n=1 Tax=Jiangella alkaliphila TaxID=419479 RepID=A0A1H2HKP9_9ACTN|nr:hypothetical protein [Jiangella alkaliphila]SDU32423.1 hypothetical protein SAMN04488563_1100 [Jiangella alkaliphila]
MAEDPDELETVKYYTRARKFPQLLGRMPDGTKIPGGPYTVQQLIAAILIIVVGGLTIDTWGVFGVFGNIAVLFGAAFGAVFLIGRLPMNGRNPLYALLGLYRAMNSPASGRYQGRPVRFRRPRRVHNRTSVYLGPLPGTDPWAGLAPGVTVAAGELPDGLSDGLRRRLDRTPPPEVEPLDAPATAIEPVAAQVAAPLSGVQALLALLPADQQDQPPANGRRAAPRPRGQQRTAVRHGNGEVSDSWGEDDA